MNHWRRTERTHEDEAQSRAEVSAMWAERRANRLAEAAAEAARRDVFHYVTHWVLFNVNAFDLLQGYYQAGVVCEYIEAKADFRLTSLHFEQAKELARELLEERRQHLEAMRAKFRPVLEEMPRMTNEEAMRQVICAQRGSNQTLALEMRNLYIYRLNDVESEHKTPDPKHVLRRREPQHGKRHQGYGY